MTSNEIDDQWFRALFDASTVPMAIADEDGLLTAANDAYCTLVGRSWADIAGKSSREFTHPDDLPQHAAMETLMADAAARDDVLRVEKRYLRPDGTIRWGWVSTATVVGPCGRSWTSAVIHDTTDRRSGEDALQTAALTDPLTGLLNRGGWREQSAELFDSTPAADSLAIAMIDFDRFKTYNDSYGHSAGDRLLVDFSSAAMTVVPPPALIARWGGEEFAIALPNAGDEDARAVLGQLAAAVPDRQTFSAGLTARQPEDTVHSCIDRADRLLYRAKRDGGSRVYSDL